jgi:ABC-2 type transport system permease protein
MPPAEARGGSIYDLGYRRYDGPRLGRQHAVMALYLYSLRGAFGIGRRTSSKIIPIIITVIAFLPALIQLGVAAIVSDDVDVIRPENYFGFVQVPVALFCAAIAPEITGRDMRQRTLSLYFSRALLRRDYALAKLAAFATALTVLTLAPQALLLLGNGLATNDLGKYVSDNWEDLPRTVGSGAAIAVAMGAVAMAIASQTSRRAYATIAVVAWFLVTWPIAAILVLEVGGAGRAAALLSPFDFVYGATMWVFGVSPERDSVQDVAGIPLWGYGAALAAHAAGGAAIVIRRFERIAA